MTGYIIEWKTSVDSQVHVDTKIANSEEEARKEFLDSLARSTTYGGASNRIIKVKKIGG